MTLTSPDTVSICAGRYRPSNFRLRRLIEIDVLTLMANHLENLPEVEKHQRSRNKEQECESAEDGPNNDPNVVPAITLEEIAPFIHNCAVGKTSVSTASCLV